MEEVNRPIAWVKCTYNTAISSNVEPSITNPLFFAANEIGVQVSRFKREDFQEKLRGSEAEGYSYRGTFFFLGKENCLKTHGPQDKWNSDLNKQVIQVQTCKFFRVHRTIKLNAMTSF